MQGKLVRVRPVVCQCADESVCVVCSLKWPLIAGALGSPVSRAADVYRPSPAGFPRSLLPVRRGSLPCSVTDLRGACKLLQLCIMSVTTIRLAG